MTNGNLFETSIVQDGDNEADQVSLLTGNDELNAAAWESTDVTTPNRESGIIKPFSSRDIQKLFNNILSKYSKCKDNVQFMLGSLAVSMKGICATDGVEKKV